MIGYNLQLITRVGQF